MTKTVYHIARMVSLLTGVGRAFLRLRVRYIGENNKAALGALFYKLCRNVRMLFPSENYNSFWQKYNLLREAAE
jgi:hypothetical protein